jgi:hypothetical protein
MMETNGRGIPLRPSERIPTFATSHAPLLNEAWDYSRNRYQQIEAAISQSMPEFVACTAVSGSLARMEAHQHSDIDLMIVIDDRAIKVTDGEATRTFDQAWHQLDALGAIRPKPGGIFSQCVRWNDLIDPSAKGRVDESIVTFGHRIQLLMDAQPVTSPGLFCELQSEILDWYSETRLASIFDEPGPFHWLWHDAQRYWRSLRSRTCWLNAHDTAKSIALNVKLRSSRLMLVFAFLSTLHQQQKPHQSTATTINGIQRTLTLTPAERLFGTPESVPGLTSWEVIWTYLQQSANHPAAHLPTPVKDALAQLAQSIDQSLTTHGWGSHNRHWLM